MACAYITDLANLIYTNLGSPSNVSVSSIQSKLVSTGFLGKLNNLISSCYAIDSGDISPELGINEQAIYVQMYMSEYYIGKINQIAGGTDINWTSIQDGDSRVTRSSQTEVGKLFKDLKGQSDAELIRLVGFYKMNSSSPASVDFCPPPIR